MGGGLSFFILTVNQILPGIEVNLIDEELNAKQIESITDVIEQKILEIIPDIKKEYIFVEIER